MCNLYSFMTNQEAVRAFTRAMVDRTGNLPPMPGIFPDYAAPIVRNGPNGRELVTARWGMPSSQLALMDATTKRATKLEGKGIESTSRRCFAWSRTSGRPTSATRRADTGSAGSKSRPAASYPLPASRSSTASRGATYGLLSMKHGPWRSSPGSGPTGRPLGRCVKARRTTTCLGS